jgi:hypothetical protein
MLKAMPPDSVKELALRRLEEIERYQAAKPGRQKKSGKTDRINNIMFLSFFPVSVRSLRVFFFSVVFL